MKKKFIRLIAILAVTAAIIYTLPLMYCGLVLNSSEVYPEDDFLKTAKHKRATILVAHDDDWYGCVGTVKGMCQSGWVVSAYCFYQEPLTEEAAVRIAARKEGLGK